MTGVLLATGMAVLVATTVDTIITAMRVETHSGPITRGISRVAWRLCNTGRRSDHGPPPATGVLVTLSVVGLWLLLTFIGWLLIFFSSDQAVIQSSTGRPADAWSRVYYTAYVISTLGIGDYVPGGPPWQVLTGIAATSGFALATLVITYTASLTTAVAHKRQLARTISQLGTSPQDVLLKAWDGSSFAGLRDHLVSLAPALNDMAEQHMTYPVLYFYRARERHTAHWASIATLDETLFILDELVDPRLRPHPIAIEPARAAISAYTDTVPAFALRDHVEAPPAPRLQELCGCEIPLRTEEQIAEAVHASAPRRSRLATVLRDQGWEWHAAVE
jgi:Ion channel